MPSLSEILKMCGDLDAEDFVDPETCEHKEIINKMYCSFCEACGRVVEENYPIKLNAIRNEDGTYRVYLS